jgi:hypothetical protein
MFIFDRYLILEEDLDIDTIFVTSIFPILKVVIVTGKTRNDCVQYLELELKVFKPLTLDRTFTDLLLRLNANSATTKVSLPCIKTIQLVELACLRFVTLEAMWESAFLFRRPTFKLYGSSSPGTIWPGSQSDVQNPKSIQQYIATILELMKRAAFCYKVYKDHPGTIGPSPAQMSLVPPALYFSILPHDLAPLVANVSGNSQMTQKIPHLRLTRSDLKQFARSVQEYPGILRCRLRVRLLEPATPDILWNALQGFRPSYAEHHQMIPEADPEGGAEVLLTDDSSEFPTRLLA